MQKRAVVLGGGMIGRVVARDLAADADLAVQICDIDAAALASLAAVPRVERVVADVCAPGVLESLIAQADVVVGAMPSHLALATLRRVIAAGKPCVDIAFMAEDATALNDVAVEGGVAVVVDCGVAPGLTNVLAGYELARFDRVDRFRFYVGGLPVERRWPFSYKAGFAPADVIEEYTRPARIVVGGREVVRPALSEVEALEFAGIGTLEAFNTDGLRSLLRLPVPEMSEKTLRYPGHAELMRVLREVGFFGQAPVRLADGQEVVPLRLTQALLFPQWTFAPGEADLTVFRVEAEGVLAGVATRVRYDMVDHYDPATGMSSMGRTTGFPCAIVARMLLRGEIAAGVHPPEVLGAKPGFWPALAAALAARGVQVTATETPLPLSC